MQKNKKYSTVILAIFRPADPVREILRDYASCKGCGLLFYDHLLDALSRMPITDAAPRTLITARPEGLSSDGVAAFEMLMSKDNTHYALWLDRGEYRYTAGRYLRPTLLHNVENLHQFDAILKNIESASQKTPPPCLSEPPAIRRRPFSVPSEPLSSEELDALLEIGQ